VTENTNEPKLQYVEIKNRYNGSIIIAGEYESIKDALQKNKDADLSSANLRYADLSSADLSSADLSYANLSYANLSYADLSYANLRYANLRYADLSYANLRYADLRYADLSYANLSSADLSYANLSSANLRYADLDFSCWPLACKYIGVIVDCKIAMQLAYHFAGVKCDDPEYLAVRNSILEFVNKSHLVTEHGLPLLQTINVPAVNEPEKDVIEDTFTGLVTSMIQDAGIECPGVPGIQEAEKPAEEPVNA